MSLQLVAVRFETDDPEKLAKFWAGMLDRNIVGEVNGALLPGDDTQVGLRFVKSSSRKTGLNRVHLHLTSSTHEDQLHMVDKALALGGGHVDVGQRPEEGHIVLADPGGNEFCVIEPGNNYLAGCGLLGEVACKGTRRVGLFWRDAIGWPLVWDQNEETAIQSPRGGTKLAWGGQPVDAIEDRNRQRFDLAASDIDSEVERLVALGATVLGERDGSIELSDPDGVEFRVSPVETSDKL